ncbi:hypothetical protein IWX90DRAFT_109212 [Phyllosticta citrichinensis]|uniref:Uncharacterized protein n=1 Tax=Phyllosticta citrichinensis TaxID=1130410 RepID=A0ABR1Y300_9PEZI
MAKVAQSLAENSSITHHKVTSHKGSERKDIVSTMAGTCEQRANVAAQRLILSLMGLLAELPCMASKPAHSHDIPTPKTYCSHRFHAQTPFRLSTPLPFVAVVQTAYTKRTTDDQNILEEHSQDRPTTTTGWSCHMPHGPCKTADQVCGYLQSNSIGYIPFLNPLMTAASIRSASSISALLAHSSTYSRDPRAWVGGLHMFPLELDFPDCYCLARCHHFTIVELAAGKPHAGQRRESVARRDHLACTTSPRNSFKCTEKTAEHFERAKLDMNVLGFLQTRPGPLISSWPPPSGETISAV